MLFFFQIFLTKITPGHSGDGVGNHPGAFVFKSIFKEGFFEVYAFPKLYFQKLY